MVTGSLARRYARAAFSLASDQGSLDKVGADLRSLATAMKSSTELVSVLTNPAVRRSDRKKVIDALVEKIGMHATSKNLIALLLDGERLGHLEAISRELDAMIEARAGKVSAEVVSAQPLTSEQLDKITVALEKLSGKKVAVTRREDPAILGGVIAKVGDLIYDGSVRSQLRQLRDDLTR